MSASQTPEPGTERTLRSTARNPRRRQRQSDGDSLRNTAPRRKRSKLSENTFAARETTEETDDAASGGVGTQVVANGHPRGSMGRRTKDSTPLPDATELPVRGGKKPGTGTLKHRPLKGDGATVLAQNNVYSVKLLPSTPKELRGKDVTFSGSLLSTTGHGAQQHLALAVTGEKAYVWDYTAHTAVSNAKVFDVPFPAREGEQYPFGALVPGALSGDVGLVLVSATTGRVVFWESLERAASIGLFQERRAGVEGVVAGWAYGEVVNEMTSAEHAGFILTLSSGRIIQLTLRDAQGKARVFTQPLRPGEANGGLFGSIKGWYSGVWKQGVATVRTRSLDVRGQMQAVSLTQACEIQIWDVDWSGRYGFRGTVDFREMLMRELKSSESPELQGGIDTMIAEDFVIVDHASGRAKGNEVATLGAEQPLRVWILLGTGPLEMQEYHLAQLSLAGDMVNIERVIKLESYSGPERRYKPKLLIPKPGHTAMVVFENAVVLVGLSETETSDDPNAQLHQESYIEPQAFEDAVFLQKDKHLAVMGTVAEDTKGGHSSAIAFVQSAGLVRITAVDPSGDVERSRIPIKSKIEQAVFYGALQDNVLDFSRNGDSPYAVEEVEEAALAISDEILRSDSTFISTTPTSIEAHLDHRANALRALVTHVRRNYPALSETAMWQLLWDAEKVAAAQQMWMVFEEHKTNADQDRRTATIVDELCTLLERARLLEESYGQEDLVRSFFVRGLRHIDNMLSHIFQLLETLQDNGDPPDRTMRLVAEADELWQRALETVFTFRTENSHAYGINPDHLSDGILSDLTSYTSLPTSPWTSSHPLLHASSKIPKLSREFAKQHYEAASVPAATIKQVTDANPALIKLCCLIYRERIAYLTSRPSQKDQAFAQQMELTYEKDRYEHFRALASIGSADQGMALAEKYGDMQTLTELVVGETQYYVDELQNSPNLSAEERSICVEFMQQMTERIDSYFTKFGDEWANAFFDEAFSGSRAGNMLEEAQRHWRVALTKYLRAEPARAKICWINDVVAVGDYAYAGWALLEAGMEQEMGLWGKKVELSLGKLALLAAEEDLEGAGSRDLKKALARPASELKIVEIQERVYAHVRAECPDALDHEARVQLAMDRLGTRTRGYASLRQLLEMLFERLLSHQALSIEELIDVLTLMDSLVYEEEARRPDANLGGEEFALALRALEAVAAQEGMEQERWEGLVRLVWKRCYVYDDWTAINNPQTSSKTRKGGKTDTDVQSHLRATATWRTLFALQDDAALLNTSSIRVLPPSECLDAACKSEDLAYRFPSAELLEPILHDNRLQDEVLQGYVVDRGLDEWVRNAERDAKEAVNAKADGLARLRERERRLEEEVEGRVVSNGTGNEHGKEGNGHANGVGGDGDGDVEMA